MQEAGLILIIEILHDIAYQNPRSHVGIIPTRSCRTLHNRQPEGSGSLTSISSKVPGPLDSRIP